MRWFSRALKYVPITILDQCQLRTIYKALKPAILEERLFWRHMVVRDGTVKAMIKLVKESRPVKRWAMRKAIWIYLIVFHLAALTYFLPCIWAASQTSFGYMSMTNEEDEVFSLEGDQDDIQGQAKVLDADIIKVSGWVVNLKDIRPIPPTYETDPVAGLKKLIHNRRVMCRDLTKVTAIGKEWYIGTCYTLSDQGDLMRNINRSLVYKGLAVALGKKYLEQQKLSKEQGFGMWGERKRRER